MTRPPRLAWVAWIAVCVIWGTTYLGIRIALESIPPALMAAMRWLIAGGILALVQVVRRDPLPGWRTWPGLALLGLLMIGFGNGLVVWAEQFVPSGLTAVVIATSPFWMVASETIVGGERLSRGALAGLIVGFAGIVLLVLPDLRAGGVHAAEFAGGLLALQLACVGWAAGSSYSRRRTVSGSIVSSTAMQMLFGGALMLAIGSAAGEWHALAFTPRTLGALVYLTLAGSLGAFLAYMYALQHLPVSTVSLYAYINPIIAVVLGALLLGEPFGLRVIAAAGLVLAGLAIVPVRCGEPDRSGQPRTAARERRRGPGPFAATGHFMTDRLPSARQLAPGDAGVGFFLCTSKELRPTRNGDLLAVGLQDTTGQVAARLFDNVALAAAEFEAGEFVKVQGRAQIHNGRLQLVLERIRRTMESDRLDGFSEDACIESAPRPLDEMWAELQALVANGIGRPHLRQLLEDVLAVEGDRLRTWPAAVSVHHAYRGGLLEHVLSVTAAARRLADAYGADLDLVTAGAILHDIGKLHELDGELAPAYTREGNLVGHITIGAGLVDAACRRVPGFPDDLRTHLVHLVVSHHGERDHGSPVVPMTTEAYILAAADDLDAKLHQVRRAIAGDPGNGEFTAWVPRLDRRMWKGVAGNGVS